MSGSAVVAAELRGVPHLAAQPVDVPPHVATRGAVVGLDLAVLHPLLQRPHGHVQDPRSLAGGHERHGAEVYMISERPVRVSARFSAHCIDLRQMGDQVETKLMSTGNAARHLGVSVRSLQQWARDGVVVPDMVTPGGHGRWDIDRLKRQHARTSDRPA